MVHRSGHHLYDDSKRIAEGKHRCTCSVVPFVHLTGDGKQALETVSYRGLQ